MKKVNKTTECGKTYTTVKVTGVFVGMLCRLFRSIVFNLLMLLLGFCVGYSYIACRIHYYATKCDSITYIRDIENRVNELTEMDKAYIKKEEEMQEVLKQFWMKLSHDHNSVCTTPIGKILVH